MREEGANNDNKKKYHHFCIQKDTGFENSRFKNITWTRPLLEQDRLAENFLETPINPQQIMSLVIFASFQDLEPYN